MTTRDKRCGCVLANRPLCEDCALVLEIMQYDGPMEDALKAIAERYRDKKGEEDE